MQMLGEIVRTKEAGIIAHAALGKGERPFAVLEPGRLKTSRSRATCPTSMPSWSPSGGTTAAEP